MSANHILSLRVNTQLLRHNVDVLRILDRLLEDRIITNHHASKVRGGTTRQERARILFEEIILGEGLTGGFYSIIRGLRESGQPYIADLVENTHCDSGGDLPRDRQNRNKRIYFRPRPCGDTDEAATSDEDTVIQVVQQQLQSTQQASVREQVIKKYELLVEGVELMPMCLSVLPKNAEKAQQMEQDWRSGAFKTFVMVVLCQQREYRSFRNTWEVDITIESRRVEEEDVSEVEYESDGEEIPAADASGPELSRLLGDLNIRAPGGDQDPGRAHITHTVVLMNIRSTQYSPKDLHVTMHSNMQKGVHIPSLRDDDGLTVLHELVLKDRGDLIVVFYDLGLLNEMYRSRVTQMTSRFYDMTPLGMADFLKKRCKDDLDKYILMERKMTKMCKFARRGLISKMQDSYNRNPRSVHYKSEGDGSMPIHWAAVWGSQQAIQWLLEHGADIQSKTQDGERILTKVCSLGHIHLLEYLIRSCGLNTGDLGLGDKSALERAAETGDFDVVNKLTELGAEMTSSILHCSARTGQAAFIQKVVDKYRNELNISALDQFGRTALFLAAENCHISTIQVLISLGIRLNVNDIRNRNALHYAADAGSLESCEIILETAQRHGCAADMVNTQEKYLGAEQCFLVRGRDKGQYAWHYVIVDRGVLSIFKQVINRGQVDVGKYGSIIMSGWGVAPPQDVVDRIAKRFEPTIVKPELQPDLTPFHYAIVRQNEDIALKMLDYGANPNITDSFGMNAAHMAAMRGLLYVLRQMEPRGVALNLRDLKNRSPWDIAEANRQGPVANYLKSVMYLPKVQNFVEQTLPNVCNSLQTQRLQAMRNEGDDVKGYMVGKLRDLESTIHDMLYEMGTTPVMQATQATEEAAAAGDPGGGPGGGGEGTTAADSVGSPASTEPSLNGQAPNRHSWE